MLTSPRPLQNELATLEFIHCLVETLDRYFSNVCELDLMFNLEMVGQPGLAALQGPAFSVVHAPVCTGCLRFRPRRTEPTSPPTPSLRSFALLSHEACTQVDGACRTQQLGCVPAFANAARSASAHLHPGPEARRKAGSGGRAQAHFIVDEMLMNGCIVETNKHNILAPVQLLEKAS